MLHFLYKTIHNPTELWHTLHWQPGYNCHPRGRPWQPRSGQYEPNGKHLNCRAKVKGHCKRIVFSYSFPAGAKYWVTHIAMNGRHNQGKYVSWCGLYIKKVSGKETWVTTTVQGWGELAVRPAQQRPLEPHAGTRGLGQYRALYHRYQLG